MEEKVIYQMAEMQDNGDLIVNKAFTIAIKHVGMLVDLETRGLGKNASEIVRKAIEAYYNAQNLAEDVEQRR